MPFEFDADLLHDFDRAVKREWIETNGVGGWASSTIVCANTRRYHGLLVAGSRSRSERRVLVSKLDETLVIGDERYELGCNRYPGAISPLGFEWMTSFRRDLFPEFEYEAGGVRLRKTIVCPRGENTTIVLYEVLEAASPFQMRLRPFFANRDFHSLMKRSDEWTAPVVTIDVPGATFEPWPDWYYNFEYEAEQERGLDFSEDLQTPGEYVVELEAGARLPVVLSVGRVLQPASPGGLENPPYVEALIERERTRREQFAGNDLFLAADQFIVDRDAGQGIIAGYHWFGEWGRDAMISLPGLCLATGRTDDAREVLRRFLSVADRGMIPNRFPEGSDVPEYNSVDAGLWLFVAVWHYVRATGDLQFVPALVEMIEWLDRGTRFNIHVDDDGLLYAGAAGVQLTWMDAKVGDWVVTPRRGKPVEVNALWYNALQITAELTNDDALHARAEAVRLRFSEVFWNEQASCCYDVVEGAMRDGSIRPNQLFALSLPFPLIEGERAESVLRVCEAKLLTPYGLRTLSPDDDRYRGTSTGPQSERDAAYHQGTVWPWLIGAYSDAVQRVRGERPEFPALIAHLSEAGLGSISEVFDGDAPHTPRGCIAQAWSVAELLRVAVSSR
jgi:predicted glycogen debranching enzyme